MVSRTFSTLNFLRRKQVGKPCTMNVKGKVNSMAFICINYTNRPRSQKVSSIFKTEDNNVQARQWLLSAHPLHILLRSKLCTFSSTDAVAKFHISIQIWLQNSVSYCRIPHKYELFHILLHLHSNPYLHYITKFQYNFCIFFFMVIFS